MQTDYSFRVLAQSLEQANKRVEKLELKNAKMKEELKNVKGQYLNVKGQYLTAMNESKKFVDVAVTTVKDLEEKLKDTTVVNELFREFVLKYHRSAEYVNGGVNIVVGKTTNGDKFGVFVSLKDKKYSVGASFAEGCLHLDHMNYPCGGRKVSTMDEVYSCIKELTDYLPTYLTDKVVAELTDMKKNAEDQKKSTLTLIKSLIDNIDEKLGEMKVNDPSASWY